MSELDIDKIIFNNINFNLFDTQLDYLINK